MLNCQWVIQISLIESCGEELQAISGWGNDKMTSEQTHPPQDAALIGATPHGQSMTSYAKIDDTRAREIPSTWSWLPSKFVPELRWRCLGDHSSEREGLLFAAPETLKHFSQDVYIYGIRASWAMSFTIHNVQLTNAMRARERWSEAKGGKLQGKEYLFFSIVHRIILPWLLVILYRALSVIRIILEKKPSRRFLISINLRISVDQSQWHALQSGRCISRSAPLYWCKAFPECWVYT